MRNFKLFPQCKMCAVPKRDQRFWTPLALAAFLFLAAATGCSDDKSKFDSLDYRIFFKKLGSSSKLSEQVESAIDLADVDSRTATSQLKALCDKFQDFKESLYGPNGWEFPRGFPLEYRTFEDGLYAPMWACDLHNHLLEGSIGSFAKDAAEFFRQKRCLDRFPDERFCVNPFVTDQGEPGR